MEQTLGRILEQVIPSIFFCMGVFLARMEFRSALSAICKKITDKHRRDMEEIIDVLIREKYSEQCEGDERDDD
jgi:hypothetical protein